MLRAKIDDEQTNQGRNAIVVKELPYQVNKAVLLEKIAELDQEKLEKISDLNQSDIQKFSGLNRKDRLQL